MDKQYETFIFDLDGTLLDTVPDLTRLTNMILRKLGEPEHTQAEILSYVGAGVRRLIYMALPSDTPEAKVDEAMELWNENFAKYDELTTPYDGVPQLLHTLRERGCKLGVMSNKLQAGVNAILEKKLPGDFKVALGECEGVPRKPDPSGIEQAVDRLGSVSTQSIYIGDSPNDIIAGKRAGCATAAALWGYHAKEDFANAPVIDGVDAIPDIYVEHPLDLLDYASA